MLMSPTSNSITIKNKNMLTTAKVLLPTYINSSSFEIPLVVPSGKSWYLVGYNNTSTNIGSLRVDGTTFYLPRVYDGNYPPLLLFPAGTELQRVNSTSSPSFIYIVEVDSTMADVPTPGIPINPGPAPILSNLPESIRMYNWTNTQRSNSFYSTYAWLLESFNVDFVANNGFQRARLYDAAGNNVQTQSPTALQDKIEGTVQFNISSTTSPYFGPFTVEIEDMLGVKTVSTPIALQRPTNELFVLSDPGVIEIEWDGRAINKTVTGSFRENGAVSGDQVLRSNTDLTNFWTGTQFSLSGDVSLTVTDNNQYFEIENLLVNELGDFSFELAANNVNVMPGLEFNININIESPQNSITNGSSSDRWRFLFTKSVLVRIIDAT